MFINIKVFIYSKKAQRYYFGIFKLFNIYLYSSKPQNKEGGR